MTDTSRRGFIAVAGAALGAGACVVPDKPAPAAANTSIDTPTSFVRLSCLLTGLNENELPADAEVRDVTGMKEALSAAYLNRLRLSYPAEMSELFAFWSSIQSKPDAGDLLATRLKMTDATAQKLRLAARQVIKIWFLSTIDDPTSPLDAHGKSKAQIGGDLGQYQYGLVWSLIGAPVPGYSDMPHAHWVNQPQLTK